MIKLAAEFRTTRKLATIMKTMKAGYAQMSEFRESMIFTVNEGVPQTKNTSTIVRGMSVRFCSFFCRNCNDCHCFLPFLSARTSLMFKNTRQKSGIKKSISE